MSINYQRRTTERMKRRRRPDPTAESRGAARSRASRTGTQGQSPNQAGGLADGLQRWPGADTQAGYESWAGFQPGCSQFPLPALNEGWMINALPGQARRKRPFLAMRQREDLTGRGAAPTARPAPLNGGAPSPAPPSPKHKTATQTPRAALHTCAVQDQAPGACLQGQSCKEEPGPCRVLPCRHLSLLPRQLRITENNSFLSIRTEFFF